MKRHHPGRLLLLVAITAMPLELSAQTPPPIRMWEPVQGSRVFAAWTST